jgi:large subunit ribosomal protein L10
VAGPRADKVAVVDEVKDQLERADAAILTEYRGLKVADLANLRRALRGAGAEFKIYKNTLVRRATAETGTSAMDPLLEGPTGIAFVENDVAAVAKVLRDFARTNPALIVKGSYVGGSLFDASSTSRLADLPPRETLLAQIAGAFAAPMQQFAGLLKALPQNLAYGISAVIDQKREAGDMSGDAAPVASADDADSASAPTTGETVVGSDDSAAEPTDEAAPEGAADADGDATSGAEEAAVAAADDAAPGAESAADDGSAGDSAAATE